jgi:hypothetical protein
MRAVAWTVPVACPMDRRTRVNRGSLPAGNDAARQAVHKVMAGVAAVATAASNAFQTDYASSILVTRSTHEGPGQRTSSGLGLRLGGSISGIVPVACPITFEVDTEAQRVSDHRVALSDGALIDQRGPGEPCPMRAMRSARLAPVPAARVSRRSDRSPQCLHVAVSSSMQRRDGGSSRPSLKLQRL